MAGAQHNDETLVRQWEGRRRLQRQALEKLALRQASGPEEIETVLREVTASSAAALGVERVSVWSYTPARDGITCLDLYELSRDHHSEGASLLERDFPGYFRAMASERAIVASDARTDPATREFSPSYLVPHGISSMLDAPIRVGGELFGVVCHEHVGPARVWTPDEVDFTGSVADLTALAISTSRLRQSEELLQLALDAGDIGTFVWSPRTEQLVWDERTHQLFDWPPERFRGTFADLSDRVHPDDRALLKAAFERSMSTGGEFRALYRARRRDGSERIIESRGRTYLATDGSPDHLSGVCFDISERYHAEQRAYEHQKLESLGLLAGGIAHDFNNLLVGVLGNASLLLMDTQLRPETSSVLLEIQAAGERAANLCGQLLAYAGRGSFAIRPVDLSALVTEASELHRAALGKGVRVRAKLEPSLPAVDADITQLRQVLMNLAINASEAIGAGEGTITITTKATQLDTDTLSTWPESGSLAPGPYVLLSVADDGPGIDPALESRIFDPFFSTKGPGRGLGLAAIQGIVRRHHGALRLASSEGAGARFDLLLPASDEPAPRQPGPCAAPATRGVGTALVIDDEPLVQRLARAVLERAGYRVVLADNGDEALARYTESPEAFAVAVVDLTMPGVRGIDVAIHLRTMRPELPIVICSGYSEDQLGEDPVELRGAAFVHKPYRAADLLASVREVIAASQGC
ncbi:Blue-light-activated protein [Enhygromyxa salina]|uniref:histidine kinase n=1 Tax=Enhygromyxa salina TaxID=215803 RepID=A0A2S9XMU5_9BACT|nr:response regulator [Enhygromyxa salina]PRP94050.1 Blue-light-activated protein [Enhygromyxa salina]